MPIDVSRVDQLIQYALLVAGDEDDPFDRQLGPIHLIKYVYLGDLAYAQRNAGTTYTGVEWRFQKFGPWSQAVNERVEPALRGIGADQKTFSSDFGEKSDWVRWSLQSSELLGDRETRLPPAITLHLRPLVRKFGKDTPALLDYIYKTPPMLEAAPSELLNFGVVARARSREDSAQSTVAPLSEKKKKAFRERMLNVQKVAESRRSNRAKLIDPVSKRRIDTVYQDGLSWLDDLAGEGLSPGEKVAEFSDEVWRSTTRKGTDVP